MRCIWSSSSSIKGWYKSFNTSRKKMRRRRRRKRRKTRAYQELKQGGRPRRMGRTVLCSCRGNPEHSRSRIWLLYVSAHVLLHLVLGAINEFIKIESNFGIPITHQERFRLIPNIPLSLLKFKKLNLKCGLTPQDYQ